MEMRRRVKEQLKRIGGTQEEIFVGLWRYDRFLDSEICINYKS